ncbi:hypothetical protein C2S53_003255 [Perilla frutescens var. hirtella]|uniref:Ubiquitin-like protease family profile domain-containing protein n=1 Tax=Perilla frutescens var. hirtella TaxID=608512 RepID=A0AAD4PCL6_PERFH|nr:hypothetical protein C2S53_003255 [Perilla frutescens var. hirtella]
MINDVTYHTRECDDIRVVQNSGVMVVAKTMQVASAKDKHPVVVFYGRIEEIWELDYQNFNVVVFKCSWIDNNGGVKIDPLGFKLVNLNRIGYRDDSFILGSQAKQVFYVEDGNDTTWSVVFASLSKEYVEFINNDELGDIAMHHQCFTTHVPSMDLNDEGDENELSFIRRDCDGTWVLEEIMDSNESQSVDDTGIESKDSQSSRSLQGKICLHNLAKRKAKRVKEKIDFNKYGQPVGPAASEMQSYIGLLARKEVKIIHKTWKHVPQEVRELIWESVNLSYTVELKWESGCLESANAKWKQWKSKLYIDYIVPHKDNHEMLNDPPQDSGVLPEDWSRFVISRLSDEFKKDELCGDDDIDRAVMWKKARVVKDKEIEDENLKKAVLRIDDYIRQKEDGVFKPSRLGEDLLTCALESPEHSGRVRAIGSYVTPSVDEKGSCSVKLETCSLKDDDDDVMLVDKLDALQGNLVSLLEANSNDVIAYGTVMSTVSGGSIPEDRTCVSIDEVVNPKALLPYPILDICENVGDALGSHVAWPTHLVLIKENMPTHKIVEKKQVVKTKNIKGYQDLNPSLKALYCYCEGALKDGDGISMASLVINDIIPFCELEPISGNCIVVYIWKLYKEISTASKLGGFRFVNPFSISYVPKSSMNVRTQHLAERLAGVSPNELVIVPCNVGHHWILTVIDPHKEIVYLLDPLSNRNRDQSWKNIVDMAITLFNTSLGKKVKKQATWEIVKAPRQPNSKQCGFYVLRFMKEIIEAFQQNGSISVRSLFKKEKYLLGEIDEVRVEWTNCVLQYI